MDLRSKDAIESSKQHDINMSNILIAEFMGMTNNVPNDNSMMVRKTPQGNEVVPIDALQYHSSWDWLMPVANEIIKSRDEQNADWDLTDLKYALQTTNIELVYKAVVEFIKGEGVVDIYAQYSFYIERCVDEVEGEIALSFEEWKQLNN